MCGHAVTTCIGAATWHVVDVCSVMCGRIAGTDPDAAIHAAVCSGATSVVTSVADAVADPHFQQRGVIVEVEDARAAVAEAKANNMPKDNIERAVKKGCGELEGEELVSMGVTYWQIGEKDRALDLTLNGATLTQQSVDRGVLPKTSLASETLCRFGR